MSKKADLKTLLQNFKDLDDISKKMSLEMDYKKKMLENTLDNSHKYRTIINKNIK